jgi:hypothetical protein
MANSLTTENKNWTQVGAWTAAAAATPAVAARAYQTVKALAGAQVFELDPGTNAMELRFTGTTNDDSLVFDLMACRGGTGDYFSRVATLTCTVGTMQMGSATKLAVDTIVISNETWLKDVEAVSDANNYMARVILDACGYHYFALVATTVAGTPTAERSGF